MNLIQYLDEHVSLLETLTINLKIPFCAATVPTENHIQQLTSLWNNKNSILDQLVLNTGDTQYLKTRTQEIIEKNKTVFDLLKSIGKANTIFSLYLNFLTSDLIRVIKTKGIEINNESPKSSWKNKGKVSVAKTKKLHELLIKESFIPEDTELRHFIAVFYGGEKPDDYRKLIWKKTHVLCVYLISELYTDGVTDWTVAYEFEIKDPDKKKIGYINNNNEKPKGYEKIDRILNEIKETS